GRFPARRLTIPPTFAELIVPDRLQRRCKEARGGGRTARRCRSIDCQDDDHREDAMRSFVIAGAMMAGLAATTAGAAEIRVMHGGAFTQVITGIVPDFEKQTGHKVTLERETVGELTKRIEAGRPFDFAILTPGAVEDLAKKGKIAAGSRVNLARVGVGVVVKAGAPA